MCQSKAKGGKRCAAHHPATAAIANWMTQVTGLDDAQAKSVLAHLRTYPNRIAPTEEQALGLVGSLRAQALRDEGLDEGARSKIVDRLDAAQAEIARGNLPNGATMLSWEQGVRLAYSAEMALDREIRASAAQRRMDPERAAAAFRHWRRNPDSFDHCESPDPAFRPNDANAPKDPATVAALRKLGWESYLAQRLPTFVYGTLREGQGNRGRFGASIEDSVRGQVSGVAIYGADRGFPYAKEHEDPDAVTVGDLVTISADREGDQARDSLDMLEGFNSNWPENSHYRRVVADVQVSSPDGKSTTVRAWTYLAGEWAGAWLREKDRIGDGDWVAAKQALRDQRYRPRYGAPVDLSAY